MDSFTDATRTWFAETFAAPTEVQARGWPEIAGGLHTLLLAPTGSGKTLAAFLHAIDSIVRLPGDAEPGVRVLYVSPLKALVYDVERNLRAPLAGIERTSERLGAAGHPVRIDVRTGDTPQKDRQRQRRDPAEILVTTPESLFLLLGSAARATLATVQAVIVDEVHAVAPTKRGAHLALSLERLAELTGRDPQRIGLSATVRPAETVAQFLGGNRRVAIVDATRAPDLALEIRVPVPDMENPGERTEEKGGSILGKLARRGESPSDRKYGLWPSVYPELLQLVQEHRSTILFTNSRSLCERLAQKLNELAGEELVLAHHGSVSHDKRAQIENALKRGDVRGIVATSSLELGIDMGAVDLVVLVESPGSIARGLQRVGRAGHQVGETSRGILFPKFRGDLLESTVIADRMLGGEIESIAVPKNALDVLAQQIVALVCDQPRRPDEVERIVRRAFPYADLARPLLTGVLEMLSGRYPSDDFADLRPRLAWDRTEDVLTARRGAPMLSRLNAGTIPDRGLFRVHLGPDGPRIGELDEEMTYETRTGDVIVLGASSWRVNEITRDRVVVEPAPGEPGRLPFWRGEGPGRPIELGRSIGAFLRELAGVERDAAVPWLRGRYPLDELAAKNLAAYVHEQLDQTGVVPTDTRITIERFRDELGDWRICILTPFGSRVHAPWAMALQTMLSAQRGFEVATMFSDDGIVLTLADGDELPEPASLFPDPDELDDLITEQLAGSALFGAAFRENAARALLLPRRNPRSRSPLWAQRLKAKNLMATAMRYADFPIVLETYRQCLRDTFDVPALRDLLAKLRSRELAFDYVETRSASPFARSLVFAYVAAYLYEYDAPLAERRAQALTLDRNLLRELLGDGELRELIDAEVLAELEAELQHLAGDRKSRDADELHDLLRKLGALTCGEVAERCTEDSDAWLERLAHERRAARVQIAGSQYWIAAQDAGLYRDGTGAMPPSGLPDEFLEAPPDALRVLLRRYARTHGPFTTEEVAERLHAPVERIEPALAALEEEGALVRGEIRPRGTRLEWCDDDVLRRLKRRTLAKLRGQVVPAEAAALARFLPRWHAIDEARRTGPARLDDVVAQLEGCALPWSALLRAILPARLTDFAPEMLDMMCAQGEIVWVGAGALGATDGRVVLYRRDTVGLLLEEPAPFEGATPVHEAILEHLGTQGASFTVHVERAVRERDDGAGKTEFEGALWDLVWAGHVTNDTFAPLRSLGAAKKPRARARQRGLMAGRWSLVRELVDPEVAPTERAHALASQLLERYGVVSREAAQADGVPGGFASVYRVLRAMEEAGRIRRGYFIEGLSGAQFALAGAVDRLRAERDPVGAPVVRALDAVDPANPWGALLPWPETARGDAARPRRVSGASAITVDGVPAVWVAPNRRSIVTFGTDTERLEPAFVHLRDAKGGRRSLVIEKVDGERARESRLCPLLRSIGFVDDYRGLTPGESYRSA